MNFYDNEINKLKEQDNFRQIRNIKEKYGKNICVNGKEMLKSEAKRS